MRTSRRHGVFSLGGHVALEQPRHDVIRDTFLHSAHHRGQMTVHSRLLGSRCLPCMGRRPTIGALDDDGSRYSASMTREDFEGIVRRALEALGVADQVTLVGADATPETGAMTARLRVGAGAGDGSGSSSGGRRLRWQPQQRRQRRRAGRRWRRWRRWRRT